MMTYKLERVAPLPRIAAKIMDELPPPVAVVMLGYNGPQRQRFTKDLINRFGRRYHLHECNATQDLDGLYLLRCYYKVHILDLKDALGGFAPVREHAVRALRFAGAKTVVGIYVDEPRPDLSGGRYKDPPNGWYPDPPSAGEFDYFVLVHDDGIADPAAPETPTAP